MNLRDECILKLDAWSRGEKPSSPGNDLAADFIKTCALSSMEIGFGGTVFSWNAKTRFCMVDRKCWTLKRMIEQPALPKLNKEIKMLPSSWQPNGGELRTQACSTSLDPSRPACCIAAGDPYWLVKDFVMRVELLGPHKLEEHDLHTLCVAYFRDRCNLLIPPSPNPKLWLHLQLPLLTICFLAWRSCDESYLSGVHVPLSPLMLANVVIKITSS